MPSDPVRYADEFNNAVVGAKSTASYAFIEAVGAADSVQGSLVVRVAIDSAAPGTQPTLYCVVTEDSLTDPLGGTSNRVARQFLPDMNGIPLNLARGDTLSDTLAFDVSGHAPRHTRAVIFIEDAAAAEPHRVLQAATVRFTEDK